MSTAVRPVDRERPPTREAGSNVVVRHPGRGPSEAIPASGRHRAAPDPRHIKRRRIVLGLFAMGLMAVLFLAYLFSISFLTEARAQSALLDQFKTSLTLLPGRGAEPAAGQPVGVLQIPRLGLQKVMVQGIGVDQTKIGPGHDPSTPLPGQVSNVVVVGRRSTFGAPFRDLDRLGAGDAIVVFTRQGRFVYRVARVLIEPIGTTAVTGPTVDSRITLITASPRFEWQSELVVIGALQGAPLSAAPSIPLPPAGSKPGLSSGVTPIGPILVWVECFLASIAAAWVLYRRWLAVPAWLLTTPVIVATSYLLFENLARLVPPSA